MLESMCKSFISGPVSLIPAGASATSVRAAYGITARNILFVALRCSLAKIAQGGTILSDPHIDVCKGGHSPEERRAFTDILAHIRDKWTLLQDARAKISSYVTARSPSWSRVSR